MKQLQAAVDVSRGPLFFSLSLQVLMSYAILYHLLVNQRGISAILRTHVATEITLSGLFPGSQSVFLSSWCCRPEDRRKMHLLLPKSRPAADRTYSCRHVIKRRQQLFSFAPFLYACQSDIVQGFPCLSVTRHVHKSWLRSPDKSTSTCVWDQAWHHQAKRR